MRPSRRALGCFTLALATARGALAEAPAASAAAEALFREGKALYAAKRYAEACPKLAESHRLDPGTGTLLLLASCHEAEGKTATAWSEFTEAAGRAKQEGRADRETAARDRAAALLAKLARFTLRVAPPAAAGLEVKLDGAAMGAPTWGSALPIDPGEHEVTASAPGKRAWTTKVRVEKDGASATVDVPALADEPVATPAPVAPAPAVVPPPTTPAPAVVPPPSTLAPANVAPPSAAPPAPSASEGSSHALAWSLAVGGGAVLVGGGALTLASVGKAKSAVDALDRSAYDGASSLHTVGLAVAGVGGAATIAGVVLFATGGPSPGSSAVRVAPWATAGGAGMQLGGAW